MGGRRLAGGVLPFLAASGSLSLLLKLLSRIAFSARAAWIQGEPLPTDQKPAQPLGQPISLLKAAKPINVEPGRAGNGTDATALPKMPTTGPMNAHVFVGNVDVELIFVHGAPWPWADP